MSYTSIQAIREAAGLQSKAENEKPLGGLVDGSNKTFTTKRRPIVDSNYDDDVTIADIQVRVNSVPVVVQSLDAATGTYVLATAPASGTVVTADYRFSSLNDDYVNGKLAEASSWIDGKLRSKVDLPLRPVPGQITTICELYAAGLILIKDWGSRADTDLTSKDGNTKLTTARTLMADYLQGITDEQANTNSNGGQTIGVISDADPFDRRLGYGNCSQDEFFFNRDC